MIPFIFLGIMNIFNPVLDPIFGYLLNLPPLFSILVITFIITLISTLIYKKMTDQEVMKSIKKEMKEIRGQMKEFKDDMKKMEELQKKSMEKSMIQFKQTMKPMLITMIPILIIFGWFSANLTYEPILPDQEFTTTVIFDKASEDKIQLIAPEDIEVLSDKEQEINHRQEKGWIFTKDIYSSNWTLKGKEGEYVLTYKYKNQDYNKELLITSGRDYKTPSDIISGSDIKQIKIDNKDIKILGLQWFWIYLISALIFNTFLRKVLKVH